MNGYVWSYKVKVIRNQSLTGQCYYTTGLTATSYKRLLVNNTPIEAVENGYCSTEPAGVIKLSNSAQQSLSISSYSHSEIVILRFDTTLHRDQVF